MNRGEFFKKLGLGLLVAPAVAKDLQKAPKTSWVIDGVETVSGGRTYFLQLPTHFPPGTVITFTDHGFIYSTDQWPLRFTPGPNGIYTTEVRPWKRA